LVSVTPERPAEARVAARDGQVVGEHVLAIELGRRVGVAVGQLVVLVQRRVLGGAAQAVHVGQRVGELGIAQVEGRAIQACDEVGLFGRVVAAVGFHQALRFAGQRADDDLARALVGDLRGRSAQHQVAGHGGAGRGC
jgi:hypothetical protein